MAIRTTFIAGFMVLGAVTASVAPIEARADRFCYYWVDADGNSETYLAPPLDVSGPPFAETESLGGHLVIGLAKTTCRRSEFLVVPTVPRQVPLIEGGAQEIPPADDAQSTSG